MESGTNAIECGIHTKFITDIYNKVYTADIHDERLTKCFPEKGLPVPPQTTRGNLSLLIARQRRNHVATVLIIQ